MKNYVDQIYGWREAEQRQLFDKSFEPKSREIIELNRSPIGYISTVTLPDRLRLLSIEIASDFQNRGIGTRLIRDLISQAKVKGLPIDLRVLKVNPARSLYERLGFSVISENETHYIMMHPGGSA